MSFMAGMITGAAIFVLGVLTGVVGGVLIAFRSNETERKGTT